MASTRDKTNFLGKIGVSGEDFKKSGLTVKTLKAIKRAYQDNRERYEKIALTYVGELSNFENIHTVRYRIKDVNHLLEKVVRKTLEGEKDIDEKNYAEKITDIIGIRVLYVFKSDWKRLHDEIHKHYSDKYAQKPEIKIKDGDPEEPFKNIKNVEIEKSMYRSIHYTLRHIAYDENTGNEICKVKVEIQTRSIFEEGWSEINHKLIYKKSLPEDIREKMVNISDILCTLAGECDQIGEVLRGYKKEEPEEEHALSVSGTLPQNHEPEKEVETDECLMEEKLTASELVDIMETYLDIQVQPEHSEKRK